MFCSTTKGGESWRQYPLFDIYTKYCKYNSENLFACTNEILSIIDLSGRPLLTNQTFIVFFDVIETWSGCETDGKAKACAKIHMDGEEHWYCT